MRYALTWLLLALPALFCMRVVTPPLLSGRASATTRSTMPVALIESTPSAAIAEIAQWASSNGAIGICAFGAAHAAAVIVCFPFTILFELAAGFAFGVTTGTALAWAAKVSAAAFTFYASSGLARSAISQLGLADAAAKALASQPQLTRLAESASTDGARYTLLARLSPVPSWANNYGLALAGVPFGQYLPATAIATLPAVLTHVYTGSLFSSLLSLESGTPPTAAGTALSGLGVVGGLLLLQQIARTAATATASVEELKAAEEEEAGGSLADEVETSVCEGVEEIGSSSGTAARSSRSTSARTDGSGPRMQLAGDSADDDPALSNAISSLRRLYYSEDGNAGAASARGAAATGSSSHAVNSAAAGTYSSLPLVAWRFPLLPQTQTVLNVWQPLDEAVLLLRGHSNTVVAIRPWL